jgi:hypothetical protein
LALKRQAGDDAMISDSICTTRLQPEAATDEHFFDSWFDPIERAVRDRVRSFRRRAIRGPLKR